MIAAAHDSTKDEGLTMGVKTGCLVLFTLGCLLINPAYGAGDVQAAGIKIISATYGGNCGIATGNATGHISRQCNGKSRCEYTVDHKVIGDPAYGCAKTYVVRYRCGTSSKVRIKSLTPEAGWGDKSVVLTCKRRKKFIYKPKADIGAPTNREGAGSR